MKVHRIDISSWTASFRYPNLISGIQPTLDVPPISTVLGLINAAAGRYLEHRKFKIAYYFEYAAKEVDLETIYQIASDSKGRPSNNAKSNVIRREFLFDTSLSIYVEDQSIVDYLKQPYYNILMGRSNDLATIEKISKVELQKVENASKLRGQIVPLEQGFLPGRIQALPMYFSNHIPRLNLGTQPFSVIKYDVRDIPTNLIAYRDSTQGKDGVDLLFHTIDVEAYD
ncbi:MAG: type I-B CRISPR-associated protein Cas5b [Bacteroidota bacterium]